MLFVDSYFQKSTNSNEKKLYKYLKNELYPAVMPTVKVCCCHGMLVYYNVTIINFLGEFLLKENLKTPFSNLDIYFLFYGCEYT